MQERCYKSRSELGTFGLVLNEMALDRPVEFNDFRCLYKFIKSIKKETQDIVDLTDFNFQYLFMNQSIAKQITERKLGREIEVI